MDFSVSPGLRDLAARFRDFVQREVVPLELRIGGSWTGLLPSLQQIRQKAKALRLWAPQLPKALGGLGLPPEEFAVVSEELGRSPLGHYSVNCQAPGKSCTWPLTSPKSMSTTRSPSGVTFG